MQGGAAQGISGLGQKIDAADGGDGGQRFAAEAHSADGIQVLFCPQLGGGVAQKGYLCVLGRHTTAVVGDAQEGHTAVSRLYRDLGSAGIHGIFNQLFYHGGRSFDYFACGDQVGNMGG